MIFLVVVLVWFAVGFINYGLTLGRFTREFPYISNVGISVFIFFMGVAGLPVAILFSWALGGFFWRIKPIPVEKRWEIFNAEYPSLGRDYFNKHDA